MTDDEQVVAQQVKEKAASTQAASLIFWGAFGVGAVLAFFHPLRPVGVILALLGGGAGTFLASASSALRQDLHPGGIVTERCTVLQVKTVKVETWEVETSEGIRSLVNQTGYLGRHLLGKEVLLTYTRNMGNAVLVRGIDGQSLPSRN